MRTMGWMAALLLGGSVLVFGQAGQGPTPPGPDTVGSDRTVHRPGQSARSDPQQNQRMTNNAGTSGGNERPHAQAGESVYSTSTAQGNIGVKGQQGEASAISGRQRAHNRGHSAKDTSVEPMRKDQREHTKAGNTSRRNSHRPGQRQKGNNTQASGPQ